MLTCMYPLATPPSLLCSNQTNPYNHSLPLSSHFLYSSAFWPVLSIGSGPGEGVCTSEGDKVPLPLALTGVNPDPVGKTWIPESGIGDGGSG